VGLDEAGTWYVPIVFGIDAESQAVAQAFGIAHNNLTVVGFSAAEVARLWRQEDYLALLERLSRQEALPVTVSQDDVQTLLDLAQLPKSWPEYEEETADDITWCECPQCGHRWPA
jgi:hypothetical protein